MQQTKHKKIRRQAQQVARGWEVQRMEPRWFLTVVISNIGNSGASYAFGSTGSTSNIMNASNGYPGFPDPGTTGAVTTGTAFEVTYLVSDTAGLAANTDPDLLNPWGVANSPFGPFWVSDNNAGVSTIYNGAGTTVLSPVGIPQPTSATGGPATGVVFHGTNDFKIGGLATTFIFSTEEGTIAGWTGASNAALAVDRSSQGAVYKGLALASVGLNTFLYAPNFNSGRIEVFDSNFNPTALAGSFTDPNADVAAGGFAPFNIASINGQLYVTYAKQNDAKHDDVGGAGNGIVDVFTTDGIFVKRLITGGVLDSPWGMAIAPGGFGNFSSDLLIGNFKDGRINAFDPSTGAYLGTVSDAGGMPITIPGLWSLEAGMGGSGGVANTLYFTAGFGSEQHGVFGAIAGTSLAATPTTTVLSATGSLANEPVTLTAGVTGAATGLVSFEEDGALIGSAALDGTGHAAITTSDLGIGTHHLSAFFSGPGTVAGSTSGTLTLTLNSHANNVTYVNQVYADLLGRTPDATGLSYWTGVLESGGSPHDLSVGITGSREYLGRVVDGFYESYLDRAPEDAGLNNWVDQLQAGATVEQVRTSILGSLEYFNRAGGTNESFVTQMFHDTLHRDPDAAGLNAWVVALDQGLLTRAEASVAISGSAEGRANTINGHYQHLLHRDADPAGLNAWSQLMASGASETIIVQSLVESAEYQANLGIL